MQIDMYNGYTEACHLGGRSSTPFLISTPPACLGGQLYGCLTQPAIGLVVEGPCASNSRSPIRVAKWALVASLLSLPLTTTHSPEARPLFCLSGSSSVSLTDISGSSTCTTTRWRLGSSSTPSARSCSPPIIVQTVVRLFSHLTVSTSAQLNITASLSEVP